MKAILERCKKGWRGLIDDETAYEKIKSGELEFKHPETITHYTIPATVFERLLALDKAQECPWISVKDKLPEKNARCLCIFKNIEYDTRVVCENTYVGDGKWWDDSDNVTHWMLVPGFPEEKEDE